MKDAGGLRLRVGLQDLTGLSVALEVIEAVGVRQRVLLGPIGEDQLKSLILVVQLHMAVDLTFQRVGIIRSDLEYCHKKKIILNIFHFISFLTKRFATLISISFYRQLFCSSELYVNLS